MTETPPPGARRDLSALIGVYPRLESSLSGRLSQQLLHHVALNIRKTEVPPHVVVGQPCMLQPQTMQERRLQIMDMNWIFIDVEAQVVRLTHRLTRLDSPAGHEHTERHRMM